MKRRLSVLVLLAMILAMLCPALAEEKSNTGYVHVTDDELLGVWQPMGDRDIQVMILPDSYAPQPDNSKQPRMYVEAVWRESEDLRVVYTMSINRRQQQQNSFLDTLLGHTMANAIKTIEGAVNNQNLTDDIDVYDYSNETISAVWTDIGNDGDFYPFTQGASGSFFAIRDEAEKVLLYWMDNYDPHVSDIQLKRVTNESPSAEALTQGVLRPVIDMADGAQAKTALALIEWASNNRCLQVEAAALAENLRAAFAALTPADAQAFKDNYARIKDVMLDSMSLNPQNKADPARFKPFEDAGLKDAINKYANNKANQRSVDLLNAAIGGIIA